MEILDSPFDSEVDISPLSKIQRFGAFFVDFLIFGLFNFFIWSIVLDYFFIGLVVLLHKDWFYTSSITRIPNIKVVQTNTKRYASPYMLVARNLLDVIFSAPFLLIPNIISILFSPESRTLGEILTGTQLVRISARQKEEVETAAMKKVWRRKFVLSLSIWLGIALLLNIFTALAI